jgi:hypothetical protein
MTPADIRLMTVPDKIRLMEALWRDLSEGDALVDSPDWHAAVLADRVSRLESGQDTFIDWDVAKKLLREECDQTIQTAARQLGLPPVLTDGFTVTKSVRLLFIC